MSLIEKKSDYLLLKVLYLYKPCINYFCSIQGTRCILKADSKKNVKKLLGGIFAKIVLKRTFPYVFHTTSFKWWVFLPVLNSFRKKMELEI